MVALAEVAGADLDGAVRQAELGDQPLGAGQQLVEQRRALLRRGDGEDLDLVELVGAQHAPSVLARRAGLAAVARGVGHQSLGQLVLVEDLVAVDRRQRHLGGGDRPQAVALDGEGVVGELRQVARRRQRGRGDERRRADLLERVGVAVEGELTQRPTHRRPEAAGHREHRPADLRRPLVVEDAERGARLPVRHALVLGELVVGSPNGPWTIGLSVLGHAVGGVGVGQVGDAQQQLAQLGGDGVVLGGELLLLLAECAGSAPPARLRRRGHRPPGVVRRPAWTAR